MSAKKQQRGQKKAHPAGPKISASAKGGNTKGTAAKTIHEKKFVLKGFDSSTLPIASSQLSFTTNPPNLETIADPSLVVLVNGLSKKSDATKEKALLDLQEYVRKHTEYDLDEGIIAAWVNLYPRLTIDNALRVRQLAHQTLALLIRVGGKRFDEYISQIVGFWLAGLYDSDKLVAQAAGDSIRQVYETQDQIRQLWKTNQNAVLENWSNIVLNERIETLSDVRNSDSDNMKAKYARVVCGGLMSIGHLISSLKQDIEPCRPIYSGLIANPNLWQFANSLDVTIRRAIYGFLRSCILHGKDLIAPSLQIISQAVIGRAALISQVGSSLAYIDCLLLLTEGYPESWMQLSSTKQPSPRAKSILIRYVKRGSQAAPPVFWEKLLALVLAVPEDMFPGTLEEVNELMKALSEGLHSRTELRSSRPHAWNTYFKIAAKLLSIEALDKENKSEFVNSWIQRIFSDYLFNVPAEESVFRAGENASETCAKGFDMLSRSKDPLLIQLISQMLSTLTDKSLLVFSDYATNGEKLSNNPSDCSIAQMSNNWATMLVFLFRILPRGGWHAIICRNANDSLLRSVAAATVDTKGVSAPHAAAVKVLLESYAKVSNVEEALAADMNIYISKDLPELLTTQSYQYLLQALVSYGADWNDTEGFKRGWINSVVNLVKNANVKELTFLLTTSNKVNMKDKVPVVPELEGFIAQNIKMALADKSSTNEWDLVKSAFKSPATIFSRGFIGDMLATLTSSLNNSDGGSTVEQLKPSKLLCDRLYDVPLQILVPHILSADTKHGESLLTKLLALTDSHNAVLRASAERCFERINKALKESSLVDKEGEGVQKLVNSIRTSVLCSHEGAWLRYDRLDWICYISKKAKAILYSIDSLVARSTELITSGDQVSSSTIQDFMFSSKDWDKHLLPLLVERPPISLGATQTLSGCIFLLEDSDEPAAFVCSRDDLNLPVALRMGLFNLRLLLKSDINLMHRDDEDARKHFKDDFEALVKSVLLLGELVADSLQISSGSTILKDASVRTESGDVLKDFMEDLALFLSTQLPKTPNWSRFFNPECNIQDLRTPDSIANVLKRLYEAVTKYATSCIAYYSARALVRLLFHLRHFPQSEAIDGSQWIERLGMRKNTNQMLNVALLTAYGDDAMRASKAVVKLRNELINDISGIKQEFAAIQGFEKLIVLNRLWSSDLIENASDIPQQRAILFFRTIEDWFQGGVAGYVPSHTGFICAVADTFRGLVPQLRASYGGLWHTMFTFLRQGFEASIENCERNICIRISLFRVFEAIRELKAINDEDGTPNDDMEDEYNVAIEPLNQLWLQVLQEYHDWDGYHEPLAEANSMLERNIYKIPLWDIELPDDLYRHLVSESISIQGAAYNILHRYVPSLQEQISIDAALSNAEVFDLQLPLELLSLLEIPTNAHRIWYHSPTIEIEAALQSLRGFYLSWLLIFDHFQNSSFKVKAAYIENLKPGNYVSNMLDLTFDFLGHTRGRPIDGSKYTIERYKLGAQSSASSGLQDLISLMIHTYYLSLRFTPSLSKLWFNECHNRQTTRYVEIFTEKYISPILMDVEFATVTKWLDDPSSEPDGLAVTVSKTVREVRATYEVDDQTMEMLVKLPSSFPLQLVEVKGTRRVAVSESQWRNWLLACQAVIALQSGSIVDGLILFQRNVKLHLDGVEECAICYSILSTVEKTLPSKGCGTCKRKFHGTCLLKWFKSSSSSSCPLCRSAFQFS